MDNDSGALILLIVLIVSAFLLIVLKLAQFVNHFSREKQYLLTEMHRAADYNEYRYWRRELRCLYLCLIPFVTERNVMKVYPVFFHRAKHAAKEKRSDGLMHILAPSKLAICICSICLCGASRACFTASASTGTTKQLNKTTSRNGFYFRCGLNFKPDYQYQQGRCSICQKRKPIGKRTGKYVSFKLFAKQFAPI